jgi:DNA-binding protein HU-beta
MAKKTAKKEAPKKNTKKAVKETQVKPEVVGVDALVAEVVAETGLDAKAVETVQRATFNAIMNLNAEMKTVQIVGFGNFEPRHRNAKKGRNPQTGEEIEIAESTIPALKTGATYKKRVKEQTPERKEPKVQEVEEAEVDTQEIVEETKPKKADKKAKSDKTAKTTKKNKKGSKKKK